MPDDVEELRFYGKQIYTTDYYIHGALGYKDYKANTIREEDKVVLDKTDFKSKRVLDIGCGRGEAILYAIRHGCKSVMGFDYSEDAIRFARDLLRRNGIDEEIVRVQDVIGFMRENTETFDIVMMLDVIEHLPLPVIRETLLHLRLIIPPGGILIVKTPYYRVFEDYISQGYKYIEPSESDTILPGAHVTKFSKGSLISLLEEYCFKCTTDYIFVRKPDKEYTQ